MPVVITLGGAYWKYHKEFGVTGLPAARSRRRCRQTRCADILRTFKDTITY